MIVTQDLTSTSLLIIFDFEPFKRQTCLTHGEMALHNKIVQREHKDLLKHPLSESFLQVKYRLIRPLFLVNIFLFSLFTLSITTLTMLDTAYCSSAFNGTADNCFTDAKVDDEVALRSFNAFYALTCLAASILFLREAVQILQTRLQGLHFNCNDVFPKCTAICFVSSKIGHKIGH